MPIYRGGLMVTRWGWLRNLGVALMVVAMVLWIAAPTNVYTWLAALTMWVVGCAMISVAGLAFIHQVKTCAEQATQTAQTHELEASSTSEGSQGSSLSSLHDSGLRVALSRR